MIAPWLLYSALIAGLISLAAVILEHLARLWGRPVRVIWLVALIASALAPAFVLARSSANEGTVLLKQAAPAGAIVGTLRREGRAPFTITPALERFELPFRLVCLVASLGVLALFSRAALIAARARRRWPVTELDGVRVLVTRDVGPAVIGFARADIVVPQWALALDARQRTLMLRHEQEHLRARDPLLLLGGGVALVLMPWNAALWWQMRRLRLAIEIDCDARVLRALRPTIATAREYASLLLTVAQRATRLRPAVWATALSESSTSLERRILAMGSQASTTRVSRTTRLVRTATFGALLGGVIVVACETPRPDPLAPPQYRATGGTLKYSEATNFTSRDVTDDATIASVRVLAARHFPELARGDTSGRPLLMVVNSNSEVVASARGASTGILRYKIQSLGVQPKEPGSHGPAQYTFKRVPDASAPLPPPSPFAGLDASSIAHTETLNFKAGVFGPHAMAVTFIRLKPGAVPPIAK